VLNRIMADPATPAILRRQAVEGAAHAGDSESVGALLRFLSPGDVLAAPAARALGTLGGRLAASGDEQAAQNVVAELGNVLQMKADEGLRLQCAVALSVIGEAAVKPLTAGLSTAPPEIAPWLAAILGAIGKPILVEAIREAEQRRPSREWVEVALALTGSPDADRFLGRLSPEDKPSAEALAQGRAFYDRIMAARRAPLA
jgi:HEAT repeat protein